MLKFPHLFSPLQLRNVTIANRILSTGRDTDLGRHGLPGDELVAYQRARAKGGAGLIIVQVVGVHETARYTAEVLMGTSDDCIPRFKRLFQAIQAEGTRAFVQLFHPVIGGGPAGMKAAAVAAEIGHEVSLHEASKRLGGQVHLAQLLPHRSEFGGLIANLAREMELAGVTVKLNSRAGAETIAAVRPDAVIIATGSVPHLPRFEQGGDNIAVLAQDVIAGDARCGGRAVIYDWRADWIGVGVAEKLAAEGAHVRLAVNGVCAAAGIQNYVRDAAIARLHRFGVETLPFMRLHGVDGGTVYFLHTASHEGVVLEGVDTLVVAAANRPVDELAESARALGIEWHLIGDALAPRTAEEAVFEGLTAATALDRRIAGDAHA